MLHAKKRISIEHLALQLDGYSSWKFEEQGQYISLANFQGHVLKNDYSMGALNKGAHKNLTPHWNIRIIDSFVRDLCLGYSFLIWNKKKQ